MNAITLSASVKLNSKPTCPKCGQLLDGATGVNNDSLPKEGDVTACISCASVMLFTGEYPNLGLRLADPDEAQEIIAENPVLGLVIETLKSNHEALIGKEAA